jgi:hypothetical protein
MRAKRLAAKAQEKLSDEPKRLVGKPTLARQQARAALKAEAEAEGDLEEQGEQPEHRSSNRCRYELVTRKSRGQLYFGIYDKEYDYERIISENRREALAEIARLTEADAFASLPYYSKFPSLASKIRSQANLGPQQLYFTCKRETFRIIRTII